MATQVIGSVEAAGAALVSPRLSSSTEGVIARARSLYFRALVPSSAQFHTTVEEPFVGGTTAGGQDMASDLSYLVRSIPVIASDPLDTTMGMSSGLNAWLGYSVYLKATKRALEAERAGDTSGERGAQLARATGAVQSAYGVSVLAGRGLAVASYIKGVDATSASAPTLLGRVTCIASTIGSIVCGFLYLMIVLSSIVKLWDSSAFQTEFEQSCIGVDPNNREQLLRYVRFFEKWSCADDGAIAVQIFDHHSPEDLRNETLVKGAEILKELLKESDFSELSEGQRKEIVLKVLQDRLGTDDLDVLRNCLQDMGLGWKGEQLVAQRRMQLADFTDNACVEEMQEIGQRLREGKLLSAKLEDGDFRALEEAQAFYRFTQPLVARMQGVLRTNFWVNVGYLVASLVGVAALIASFCTLGPLGVLLVGLGFLINALMLTGLDAYGFHHAMSAPSTGRCDKTLLVISNCIALMGLAAAIVLVSILSLGVVPLIVSVTIAVFWVGANGLVWYKLAQHAHERVGLHEFRQRLDLEEDDEKIKRLFHTLPKVDRDAIAMALDQAITHVSASISSRAPGMRAFHRAPRSPLVKRVVQERIDHLQREREQHRQFLCSAIPLAAEYLTVAV